MSEVQKYDPFGYDGLSALMHEDEYGDWVRLESYEAIKLQRDAFLAQHGRDSAELRSLCAARDQYRDLSMKYSDKLNEVLKLLAKCQEKLDPHRDAVLWGEVCDAFRMKP